MDDGVLQQQLATLEANVGVAMRLADHAIMRAGVLEAALAQFAASGAIDFDALTNAVTEDFGKPSQERQKKLDEIVDELRQRIPSR